MERSHSNSRKQKCKQLLVASSLKTIYVSCNQRSFKELMKNPKYNYPNKVFKKLAIPQNYSI